MAAQKKARKRAYIPPSSEVVNRRDRAERQQAAARRTAPTRGGVPRAIPQPSIARTLKRLPIYFLLIFAFQYWSLSHNAKDGVDRSTLLLTSAGLAAAVTLVFAPFMHVMDRMAYSRYLKRTESDASSAR